MGEVSPRIPVLTRVKGADIVVANERGEIEVRR